MAWAGHFTDGVAITASGTNAMDPLIDQFATWQGPVNANGNPVSALANIVISQPPASGSTSIAITHTLAATSGNSNIGITITPNETGAAGGGTGNYQGVNIALRLTGSFAESHYQPVYLGAPVLSGGASVSGGAVITIAAQNGSGVGGVLAINQLGPNDSNYFAGNVGVAINTPTAPIHVNKLGAAASVGNNIYTAAVFCDGGQNSNMAIVFQTGAPAGTTAYRGFQIAKGSQIFSIVRYDSACAAGSTVDFSIANNGQVGIGLTAAVISGTGKLHSTGNTARVFDSARTPATSSDAWNVGEFAFDSSYLYIAVATGTIKRVALSAF